MGVFRPRAGWGGWCSGPGTGVPARGPGPKTDPAIMVAPARSAFGPAGVVCYRLFGRRTNSMRSSVILAMTLAAVLVAAIPVVAQDNAASVERIAALKESAIAGVEARRKLSQVINDTVFSFGELAYQEFETSKYLTDVLEKNGFAVERGIAGMPTAWVARWGSGKPVIALGS